TLLQSALYIPDPAHHVIYPLSLHDALPIYILVVTAPDIAQQNGGSVDIVDRDIEETLDLVSVQIHHHDAIDTDHLQHIGHDFGRDRHTRRTGASILAGVTKVRDGGGDATGRSTAQGIDHHHDFHQIVVGGSTGGLQNENIATAHILVDFNHGFPIREATHRHFPQRHIKVVDDIDSKARISRAGEDHESVLCHDGR